VVSLFSVVVTGLQILQVAEMIQRLGQRHGIQIAEGASLRDGGVQQRLGLVVKAQARVCGADRIQ
jgi:hypothetical protein